MERTSQAKRGKPRRVRTLAMSSKEGFLLQLMTHYNEAKMTTQMANSNMAQEVRRRLYSYMQDECKLYKQEQENRGLLLFPDARSDNATLDLIPLSEEDSHPAFIFIQEFSHESRAVSPLVLSSGQLCDKKSQVSRRLSSSACGTNVISG